MEVAAKLFASDVLRVVSIHVPLLFLHHFPPTPARCHKERGGAEIECTSQRGGKAQTECKSEIIRYVKTTRSRTHTMPRGLVLRRSAFRITLRLPQGSCVHADKDTCKHTSSKDTYIRTRVSMFRITCICPRLQEEEEGGAGVGDGGSV